MRRKARGQGCAGLGQVKIFVHLCSGGDEQARSAHEVSRGMLFIHVRRRGCAGLGGTLAWRSECMVGSAF